MRLTVETGYVPSSKRHHQPSASDTQRPARASSEATAKDT